MTSLVARSRAARRSEGPNRDRRVARAVSSVGNLKAECTVCPSGYIVAAMLEVAHASATDNRLESVDWHGALEVRGGESNAKILCQTLNPRHWKEEDFLSFITVCVSV
jgi:hypothetical protein